MNMASKAKLVQVWNVNAIARNIVGHLSKDDLLVCRLTCRDLAVQLARFVFLKTTVVLRRRALTRPSRVAALQRIGAYIGNVNFKVPHSADTFLPPVIDTTTGTEQTFIYLSQGHRILPTRKRYRQEEITDILIQQYPPLFHAATNISSFEKILSFMRNIRHLGIQCEGQQPSHRYRRSVVDYALISLRIAVERASLPQLESLSLSIHPAAMLYLRPDLGFGTSPASRKRWSQIRSLTIHMDSFHYHPGLPTDHFKLLHAYLQSFPNLRTLSFHWIGERNAFPLALATEPCLQRSPNVAPSPTLQGTRGLSLRPLRFHCLQKVDLANVITDASQIAGFVSSHRSTLRQFNIQNTILRSGSWDEALAPLTQPSDQTRGHQELCGKSPVDVPLIFSQQQLQHIISVAQRQRGGLRKSKKARVWGRLWGKPRSYEADVAVIGV